MVSIPREKRMGMRVACSTYMHALTCERKRCAHADHKALDLFWFGRVPGRRDSRDS